MLENPTRYHVIQKQKNQVRQYLSESFQQTSDWDAGCGSSQSCEKDQCMEYVSENILKNKEIFMKIRLQIGFFDQNFHKNRIKLNKIQSHDKTFFGVVI